MMHQYRRKLAPGDKRSIREGARRVGVGNAGHVVLPDGGTVLVKGEGVLPGFKKITVDEGLIVWDTLFHRK